MYLLKIISTILIFYLNVDSVTAQNVSLTSTDIKNFPSPDSIIEPKSEKQSTEIIATKDIIKGDIKAPYQIVMYFMPSCNHCGDFMKKEFSQIHKEFIESGKVKFIFRLLPSNTLGVEVGRLIWSKGEDKTHDLLQFFMKNQSEWLDPIFEPKKIRKKKIATLLKEVSIKLNISEDQLKKDLRLKDKDQKQLRFLKLFCLNNNDYPFTLEQISKTPDEKEEAIINDLLLNHEASVNDKVKNVPTFLINGKLIGEELSIESLRKEIGLQPISSAKQKVIKKSQGIINPNNIQGNAVPAA